MNAAPRDASVFIDELLHDLAGGDRTTDAVLPPDATLTAELRARQPLVPCGLVLAERLIRALSLDVRCEWRTSDGVPLKQPTTLGTLTGCARDILALERTLLNALQHLSAIATETHRWVRQLPENVVLLDTRKTTAGLRAWQRYAVRCGGGRNHRYNLADTIMIKDNHIRAVGDLETCVRRAAEHRHPVRIICEVESLTAARVAVSAGAHGLLIDNVAPDGWPAYWDALPDDVTLEFSGGLTFDDLPAIPTPPRTIWISTSRTVIGAPPVDIGLDA